MSRYKKKFSSVEDAVTITVPQAQARYNVGKEKVREMAHQANALVKMGNSILIVRQKLDDYLYGIGN